MKLKISGDWIKYMSISVMFMNMIYFKYVFSFFQSNFGYSVRDKIRKAFQGQSR